MLSACIVEKDKIKDTEQREGLRDEGQNAFSETVTKEEKW